MTLDDPILAFLAQPENLPLALEIERRVSSLKDILHRQFWEEITAALQVDYEAMTNKVVWEIRSPVDRITKDYLNIGLIPKTRSQLYLDLSIEQGTSRDDYHLYLGVHWSQRTKELPALEPVKKIVDYLATQGFRQSDWWPGIKRIHTIRQEPFMVRMANEPDALIAEILDGYWSLFHQLEPDLIAANQALAKM